MKIAPLPEENALKITRDRQTDRRTFLPTTAATAAALALPRWTRAAASDLDPIFAEIDKRHDESLRRLQTWIHQPSIAAENRGMYDVKQVDPAEWSSPPWDAALVDKPGLGKVIIGRGAVNQKGPEATFLAALHAIRGAGRKIPVNFVFVAEGEEEIGSPHFPQVVHRPDILAALKKCNGIFMPFPSQGLDGEVTQFLGAKGVVELELISSGEKWGRGPRKDVHSSNKARLDSPAWHLVEALATLVSPDGNDPAIEGFAAKAR